jgi:hypothetical protein
MEFSISMKDLSKSHSQTLKICRGLVESYESDSSTDVFIDFSDCSFIYPDYALLLLCTVKYLESRGFVVKGKIRYKEESIPVKYLAGMNFFDNLQVNLPFQVGPMGSASVQIQRYTKENQLQVLHSILKLLREKTSMNENVYTGLDYCFNEILDNVLNHSEEKSGWVAAQYFEKINSVRLIVCDYGIGIHKSLYDKHRFNEEDALLKCIESGITNGKGQGHGLYATSEFVKLNRGWLSIISGNKVLNVSEKETVVKDIDMWQGTSVYIRINTNVDVDYASFTSKNYDYKKQIFEDLFEKDN